MPGAESHAAYVYCAVASLALLDALPLLDNAFERGLRAAVEAHNKPKTGNKMQTSETDTLTGAGTPTGSAAPTSQENTAPETSEKRPLRVEDYLYVSGVRDRLAWWLAERQLQSGGLNGRPEKLPDVCYSWWVLASLAILGRLEWIDADALADFILAAQDPGDAPAAAEAGSSQAAAASTTAPENKGSLSATATSTTAAAAAQDSTTPFPSTDSIATFATGAKPADATAAASPSIASAATTNVDSSAGGGGGISDRPGDMADPFHTVFGLAGLSLLAHTPRRHSSVDRGPSGQERWVALADSLRIVDPVLCMPRDSLERRGIHIKLLSSH